MASSNNYVVCLKFGTKYSARYVNTLYTMVERNLTMPHKFICYTEDPTGVDKHIETRPLPAMRNVSGWWFKPMFFDPSLGLDGTILFLDLDIIIFKNINHLFEYRPGTFLIIRDFNRYLLKQHKKFNSSVFRLQAGQHSHVYQEFKQRPQQVMSRFMGDQDWLYHKIKDNFDYWPDEWIQSYKWEMRRRAPLDKAPKGERDFVSQGDPNILNDTAIAVFHGDPCPHYCKDDWVKEHWK